MNFIINILSWAEYIISILLGKGFGGARISLKFEVKNVMKFLSNEKLTIFDIGGNIGEYTEEILKKNINCRIFIFEPSKKNSDILKKKFRKNKNITVENIGIDSKNRVQKLYFDKLGSPLSSLTKRSFLGSDIKMKGFEKAKFVTINKYMQSNHINKIDLLKLDVEGHELECLKGAINFIKKINVIQFEFGGCNIDTRTYFRDFWLFLKKYNFDLYRISPLCLVKLDTYSERYENFLTSNFIAINKDIN